MKKRSFWGLRSDGGSGQLFVRYHDDDGKVRVERYVDDMTDVGFDWSYSGQKPLNLATHMLAEMFNRSTTAVPDWYYSAAWRIVSEFLAHQPRGEWTIDERSVLRWIPRWRRWRWHVRRFLDRTGGVHFKN